VIVNLLQRNYEITTNVKNTIIKTISELKGRYSFVVMFEDGQLAVVRYHEPLIIGMGKK